jgi:hypothetical protein
MAVSTCPGSSSIAEASSRPFSRKDGRAAATKGIENDVAALRHIKNRVADQRDRFDGRVKVEAAGAAAPGTSDH